MSSHATKTLPENFQLRYRFDVAHNMRVMWTLQVIGMVMFFLYGFIFLQVAEILRPDFTLEISLADWDRNLFFLLASLLLMAGVIILHEFVHGICFWLFTHDMPEFGLGAGYAYAKLPGWYFPRWEYLIVGLSPLVVLTFCGFLLIPAMPVSNIPVILFGLTINAGGAVGDLWVAFVILRMRGELLVEDQGDMFSVFVSG